jgi:hypothetical protein
MIAMSQTYQRLVACSKAELERILVAGDTPAMADLAGWEYRGYNHPPLFSLLGIRKFIKGFFTAPSGAVYGFNTPVRQNGLAAAWQALPDEQHPKRFGFFLVALVHPAARDNAYLHAVLLDYGRGGNKPLDVTRGIRDYLVRVEHGSDDLLLGKAYIALGPARITSNFFLLERFRPLTVPPLPRGSV